MIVLFAPVIWTRTDILPSSYFIFHARLQIVPKPDATGSSPDGNHGPVGQRRWGRRGGGDKGEPDGWPGRGIVVEGDDCIGG